MIEIRNVQCSSGGPHPGEEGEPHMVHEARFVIAEGDHLDAGAAVLDDGRVAVVVVVDDLGDGVSASTDNVHGSTVAGRVRNAYDAAKGL
jgi:hypothetical protein